MGYVNEVPAFVSVDEISKYDQLKTFMYFIFNLFEVEIKKINERRQITALTLVRGYVVQKGQKQKANNKQGKKSFLFLKVG